MKFIYLYLFNFYLFFHNIYVILIHAVNSLLNFSLESRLTFILCTPAHREEEIIDTDEV